MNKITDKLSRSIFIKHLRLLIFLCCTALLSVLALYQFAQTAQDTKDKLLNKKKKLEAEIALNKKLLDETSKTKKMSISQLSLLKSQIQKREALLDEINTEIGDLDDSIRSNNEMLDKQNENLLTLKDEYAKIIYNEWKTHNSYDRLLFIFSAEDFNQAYRRLKYFQQYTDYRQKQAELIVEVQNDISNKMEVLKAQKENKTSLLLDNETEKKRLDKEKEEKAAALTKLKQKETAIRKDLKNKQNEAIKLQAKIQAIIAAEIKKSSGITNKIPVSNKDIKNILTPEEKRLSDNFTTNKGSLPWPVLSGIISEYFGEHDHPVLPGIKVKNNGIDIATGSGASARAVFNGIVSSVVSITDNNSAVIIRHGDYFTVYSNLQSVTVQKGAKVNTKQNIGTVYTDRDEGQTILHFELWEGKILQNPAEWLAR